MYTKVDKLLDGKVTPQPPSILGQKNSLESKLEESSYVNAFQINC